ncbi:hypothetical protein [uncultured Arcticibacterium sp.]|uniref:hypothetical protein n=1 Tax=uncultured Arcticibacterium sp. TaxID=2173042 RepID=UPI0030F9F1A4
MNTRIPLIALCLLMAFGLTNCKDDAVEEPIVYNFDDDFKDIKVEAVTETEPAAVESTEASVTTSASTEAAAQALINGTETAELTAAKDEIASTLSEDEAAAISATLEADGELTPAQQAQLDAILASNTFASFLPASVAPTVDGVEVNARKSTNSTKQVTLLNLTEMLLGVSDECSDAATASFNAVKATLDAAKASQDATINATFTARQTAIAATLATDLAAVTEKWATQRAEAKTFRDNLFASINNPFIRVLFNGIYKAQLAAINIAEAKDIAAKNKVSTTALANATAAKDADLATSASNYTTALNNATATAAAAAASCHNQGGSN